LVDNRHSCLVQSLFAGQTSLLSFVPNPTPIIHTKTSPDRLIRQLPIKTQTLSHDLRNKIKHAPLRRLIRYRRLHPDPQVFYLRADFGQGRNQRVKQGISGFGQEFQVCNVGKKSESGEWICEKALKLPVQVLHNAWVSDDCLPHQKVESRYFAGNAFIST
jgi:hypothetical protein